MKLSAQWAFWIALIFLILTERAQCRDDDVKGESFSAKFNRALNYFKMAFRGDEEDPLPPFDKQEAESHFQQKPQQEVKPPFPNKPQKLIEQRSLADYCSRTGPGARIQLGACSPTFVFCEREALRFEECPTGQIFVDGECRPAIVQPACFDVSSNQLNHASEKLVQATSFCRIHSAPGFLHLAAEPNDCSRQALICLTHSRAVSIACPQGSVFDSNTLMCQKFQTHPQCQFADKPLVQPIKTALERLYCAENHDGDEPGSSVPPPFPGQQISIANNGMRCKDWFVTCSHPEKEFVFCGQDSLFDKEQGACRPTRPTDNCPAIFNCRDFEWKIIPFGKCRPEFIFCRGLIPVQFQCRPGFVVFNSECVPEQSVREQCSGDGDGVPTLSECDMEGERKPDSSNCTCFHECQRDHRSILTWSNQCCKNGDGYDPNDQDCSSSFHCDSVCQEGQSFVVNCHEYFECRQKRFQAGVCPSMSSYSVAERRCVFDSTCKHPGDENPDNQPTEECHEDEFVPSKDCISYGVCKQRILHWKPCQLLNGQYHEQCPGCSAGPPSQTSAEAEPQQAPSDSSPTECTDGAVVLSRNECKRFMKCYAGHWLMVECPNDKFFSLQTQACTAETCEKSGIYLPPSGTLNQVPDYRPPVGQPWCNDTSCCTEKSPLLPVHEDCHKYQLSEKFDF